jgi:steroid delta-isomerase-like uncharacterized protein
MTGTKRLKSVSVVFCLLVLFCLGISCQQKRANAQNDRVSKVMGIWNQGNLALIDELYAADYVRHENDGTEVTGLDAFKQIVTRVRTAYPDLNLTLGEQIVQGEMAARTWTVTGTNTGPGEFPPTGKAISINGVTVSKTIDGMVVEEWIYFNAATMLTQLGFTIEPPAATSEE